MASVRGDAQARLLRMGWQSGRAENQIHLRHGFIALPEPDAVIDHVDSSGALHHLIGVQQFTQVPPYLRGVEWERKPRPASILFESAPVAFVGEGFALKNPHRGEQAPTAQQAGLARRKSYLLDLNEAVVVEHVPMDHLDLMRGSCAIRSNILTQVNPGRIIR